MYYITFSIRRHIRSTAMTAIRKLGARTFTVPEAAAILEQPLKQISNALARDLAPIRLAKGRGRTVTVAGLLALELLRTLGGLFSPKGRRRVLSKAVDPSTGDEVQEGCVVVKLAEHRGRVEARKSLLAQAEALIVRDREILGGEPSVKGTRIPAYVVGALARKHGVVEAQTTYPSIPRQTIELVALYVAANPRRGKPRQAELSKPKAPAKRGKAKKIKLD
jgi:uncharacterized protein (DUF433 family)